MYNPWGKLGGYEPSLVLAGEEGVVGRGRQAQKDEDPAFKWVRPNVNDMENAALFKAQDIWGY